MLIENGTTADAEIQLVPYFGLVNPEHLQQLNCIPIVQEIERNDEKLEEIFIEDFQRKAEEFRQHEHNENLPIEIRLGTVYTYQNRRQKQLYPNEFSHQSFNASMLRNEERREKTSKHFLITFNKNKGINDLSTFEYELTCAGFRQTSDEHVTHRLYLRHGNTRVILELKRTNEDRRFFSVKRLLKYTSKFTHIDLVKSKETSSFPRTFDDIYDIRTSIGKAFDDEEIHHNDDECRFLPAKSLDRCVFESRTKSGEIIYQFDRDLLPFFDFFQVKTTLTYDYSCIDSRFFGLRISLEEQIGYDLGSSAKTTTPCVQTKNVVVGKLISTQDDAKRILDIGLWLSDLARRCTNSSLPRNYTYARCPRTSTYRRPVR